MILQALAKYYDLLSADPESGISQPGYSVATVSSVLILSEDGILRDIFPLVETVQQGKKKVELPRKLIVPEQVKRSSGIAANFLCDSVAYVLGISERDERDPDYAPKRFEAFQKLNNSILANVDCPAARAVVNFLATYTPVFAKQNLLIAQHWAELIAGRNLVFRLEGRDDFIHNDPLIRFKWKITKNRLSEGDQTWQCLITGEQDRVKITHSNIKGVSGTNSIGGALVGFNARAYESYNRIEAQGFNAPVGERAAFAYTTALNYLLSRDNPNGKFRIGDTTIVYWAESPNQKYAEVFAGLFQVGWDEDETDPKEGAAAIDSSDGQNIVRDQKAERRLSEVGQKVRNGDMLDVESVMEGLNPDTQFYVLGLAPNAARVSVRFFHQDAFRKIVEKVIRHYQDLEIIREFEKQPKWIPLYQLMAETYSKKSSDKKASPLLSGAVMRSILSGAAYPSGLYTAIINRVRADMDDTAKRIQKINYVRAAVIKAYLTRKYRSYPNHKNQEVLGMALNEQSTNQAYLLGRLFSVLEKAQKEAIPNLNATIKDRYFTTACASPSAVFPILLRLSQHHINKAEYGNKLDKPS